MKSIDNVLTPITERISSPLYSTFIIAWCITNWKVFYATFFMSYKELGLSKMTFIQDYLNLWNSLLIPIAISGLYLFVFPYLERFVLKIWYKNKTLRKGIVTGQMKETVVTGKEYVMLLEKHAAREVELTKFIDKEKKWFDKQNEMTSEIMRLNHQDSQNNREISDLKVSIKNYQSARSATDFFKGRWRLHYKGTFEVNIEGEEFFSVENSNQYIMENQDKASFTIRYFYEDIENDSVYFLKEDSDTSENPRYLFNELRKRGKVYTGNEYGVSKNNYGKISFVGFRVTYMRVDEEIKDIDQK